MYFLLSVFDEFITYWPVNCPEHIYFLTLVLDTKGSANFHLVLTSLSSLNLELER